MKLKEYGHKIPLKIHAWVNLPMQEDQRSLTNAVSPCVAPGSDEQVKKDTSRLTIATHIRY